MLSSNMSYKKAYDFNSKLDVPDNTDREGNS